MPDSLINYTTNGWPYLDANNYVEVIPQYTDELANQLDLQVVNPDQRLTQAENDIDALDGRLDTLEGVRDIVGAGRPDIPATMTAAVAAAVAAAPSGTKFRSTNGPQGAWEWMKQGTAWVVTVGDTGWRSVPAPAPFVGSYRVRRREWAVEFVNGSDIAAGASGVTSGSTLLSHPTGFTGSPAAAQPVAPVRIGTTASLGWVLQGPVLFSGPGTPSLAAGDTLRFRQEWSTVQAWPTTLPGTAA